MLLDPDPSYAVGGPDQALLSQLVQSPMHRLLRHASGNGLRPLGRERLTRTKGTFYLATKIEEQTLEDSIGSRHPHTSWSAALNIVCEDAGINLAHPES